MMRATRGLSLVIMLPVLVAVTPVPARAGEAALLDVKSMWRYRLCWRSEQIRREGGKLESVIVHKGSKTVELIPLSPAKVTRLTLPPPADWVKADFDDGSWDRQPGPFDMLPPGSALLCLRGRFWIADPAKAGDVRLSVAFEGGAVVYVNGKEIARSHLPGGKIDAETPAKDYPKEAFVDAKGKLLRENAHRKRTQPQRYKARHREVSAVKVPAAVLRKGVNVLALELHRSPAAEVMYQKRSWGGWARLGLQKVVLTSPSGGRPGRLKGFQVWNHTAMRMVSTRDSREPLETLGPIRITGTRNGVFCGQVVAGSDAAIKGLKATLSQLKGPGTIPASAVEIRYALPDGPRARGRGQQPGNFDSLESFPPAEVAVCKGGGRAVQPIWVSVRVPANAKPGLYKGKLTVSAQGQKPVDAPVELQVADWKMPDSKQFASFVGRIQSPESVAMQYGVKLWSPKHWKLLEKSFALIGALGGKVLYVPLIAKTHFGNEHSMVRWIREPGGGWDHDFSLAERYIDMAVKYLGKDIPVACLYCWEPAKVQGHYMHNQFLGEREILFSVLDPATGDLEVRRGPDWGTPECRRFWKPVMKKMFKIFEKRGLAKSLMVGICNDFEPTRGALADITFAAPKARWVIHTHGSGWVNGGLPGGRPTGYVASVWGISGASDPMAPQRFTKQKRFYGWKVPPIVTSWPRSQMRRGDLAERYRTYSEYWAVARGTYLKKMPGGGKGFSGADGLGRLGADFWTVLKDKRGRARGSLAGHYSPWGGLDMNSFGLLALLGPGRDGAVPTVRYEMFRESIQEVEARIFIEKALTDEARKAKLGGELAGRAQRVLDDRVRAVLYLSPPANTSGKGGATAPSGISGWRERSAELYAIAADVAKAVGE